MIKSATVSARIDENVKTEAEDILQQLGIPVSVVINTLYRQIIIQRAVPFPMMLVPNSKTLGNMTKQQLDDRLQHSYEQVLSGLGRPMEDVFSDLERKHALSTDM